MDVKIKKRILLDILPYFDVFTIKEDDTVIIETRCPYFYCSLGIETVELPDKHVVKISFDKLIEKIAEKFEFRILFFDSKHKLTLGFFTDYNSFIEFVSILEKNSIIKCWLAVK